MYNFFKRLLRRPNRSEIGADSGIANDRQNIPLLNIQKTFDVNKAQCIELKVYPIHVGVEGPALDVGLYQNMGGMENFSMLIIVTGEPRYRQKITDAFQSLETFLAILKEQPGNEIIHNRAQAAILAGAIDRLMLSPSQVLQI